MNNHTHLNSQIFIQSHTLASLTYTHTLTYTQPLTYANIHLQRITYTHSLT